MSALSFWIVAPETVVSVRKSRIHLTPQVFVTIIVYTNKNAKTGGDRENENDAVAAKGRIAHAINTLLFRARRTRVK